MAHHALQAPFLSQVPRNPCLCPFVPGTQDTAPHWAVDTVALDASQEEGYPHFFLSEQLFHGLDEAIGLGATGRGAQAPGHGHGWAVQGGHPESCSGPDSLLPRSPAWLSFPTHSLVQATHLMGSSWRELVSLGAQDTQRNLVTVPGCRNGMPVSPGDPRGCERPKASRGISLQGWEEAEAGAGPGKSLS